MARTCTICTHKRRADIDQALGDLGRQMGFPVALHRIRGHREMPR